MNPNEDMSFWDFLGWIGVAVGSGIVIAVVLTAAVALYEWMNR